VRLPVLAAPAQFAWLREIEQDGNFFGYLRMDGSYDASSASLRYPVPLTDARRLYLLPVSLRPAYVQNHDASVHIWSSPFIDAVDFGVAGPQFTTFDVVQPQLGQRMYVFNRFTQNYGWIDAAGVGPVSAP
jgi:hypothetical protein